MGLSGRIAFVTGASQGIGRACAVKLASAGATVALGARNREKLDEVAKEIAAAGGKAEVFTLDVGDEEQIKAAFKAAIGQLGKIDILVGTHRLLSQDIKFQDLGLLVVDEEQRFGVRHKERSPLTELIGRD